MTRFSLSLACLLSLASGPIAQEDALAYDAAQVVLGNTDPAFVAVLDLDGDGDLDALGEFAGDLALYENDGSGVFAEIWTGPQGGPSPAKHFAVGDVDGDQRDDFAISSLAGVRVWLTNGTDAPTPLPVLPNPGFPSADVLIADLTGDGLGDLVFLTIYELYLFETVFPWGSNPMTTVGLPPLGGFDVYAEVISIHLDADGDLDLAVRSDRDVLLLPTVGGVPTIGATFELSQPLNDMAAGDLNDDGDEDIAIFANASICGWEQHLIQVSPGNFVPVQGLPAGGPATDLADVDFDGDLDGVCCGGGGGGPGLNEDTSYFEIAINDGLGDFDCAYEIVGLGAKHIAGAADLDADGDTDLIAGRAIYFSQGEWRNPQSYSWYGVDDAAQRFDYDSDGDVDVVDNVLREADGTGYLEDGDIEVQGAPASFYVNDGYPGDWDGDGDVDLIGWWQPSPGDRRYHLVANTGGGVFTWGAEMTSEEPPLSIGPVLRTFALDVEGDGDQDLVIAAGGWTELWTNDGTGFLTESVWFNEVLGQLADLDGDGDQDFVVSINNTGVGWKRNQGGGNYDPVVWLPSDSRFLNDAESVAVADVDGDLDLDFVLANFDREIALLENDGAGNFTEIVGLFPPIGNDELVDYTFAVTDANGDGAQDVLRHPGDTSEDSTVLYLGAGPGLPFTEASEQMMFPGTQVDVDADGDLDLLSNRTFKCTLRTSPEHGFRRQFGTGLAGTGGITPKLGGVGAFHAGETVQLVATSVVGGAPGFLGFGTGAVVWTDFFVPGLTLYVDPLAAGFVVVPFNASGVPGDPGAGRAQTPPYPVPPGLAGTTMYKQGIFLDGGGLSSTNGLQLVYGAP